MVYCILVLRRGCAVGNGPGAGRDLVRSVRTRSFPKFRPHMSRRRMVVLRALRAAPPFPDGSMASTAMDSSATPRWAAATRWDSRTDWDRRFEDLSHSPNSRTQTGQDISNHNGVSVKKKSAKPLPFSPGQNNVRSGTQDTLPVCSPCLEGPRGCLRGFPPVATA